MVRAHLSYQGNFVPKDRVVENVRGKSVAIAGKDEARMLPIRAYSCLKIGDPPRGRTGNLLIKSYSVDVFKRVILGYINRVPRLVNFH